MSTQLAISLLTEYQNNLVAFLSALGVLGDETTLEQLEKEFNEKFQLFLIHFETETRII